MSLDSTARSELRPGDQVGPYRIAGRIGRGGAGTVFRATDERDGSSIALKILHPILAGDPTFRARFAREIRVARTVNHPNLVPILDSGEAGGWAFLAMPFVAAGSLADEIAFAGPLPASRLLTVVTNVAAGLDALHGAGIVHRDIKPSNVLFEPGGWAALTDFGLARGGGYTALTRPGDLVGSPDYVAPELIMGGEATPASDRYALGCLVYEAVTGQAPFAGRSVLDIARGHLHEEPPDPLGARGDLPSSFGPAILSAMAKDPRARPASATAYARLIASTMGSGAS